MTRSTGLHPTPLPARGTSRTGVSALVAGLEPAQREAVLADDPVVCVVAGAGTGKTRVLTLRVARRIEDRSAHADHVLVCTFSRKAADELRDRLWALGTGPDVHAGTLHRCALGLIHRYHADHGLRPPVVVADRRPLLEALLHEATGGTRLPRRRGGSPGAATPTARRSPGSRLAAARADTEVGWAKARLVGPDRYGDAAKRAGRRPSLGAARTAEIYARYEVARRRRGALDLDDLLLRCCELLESDGAFAAAVRWRHRHLFVDEMQDLNQAQYRLLRLLVGDLPDLFVVGDPHQSVYGWNGADPGLLERVAADFTGARVVRLAANHRCTPQVVGVAGAVLEESVGLPESTRADGPLPRVAALQTDSHEAAWVAREVWRAHRPGRRWSSIAVLARTNQQLTVIAEALDAERVPYRLLGREAVPVGDLPTGLGAGGPAGTRPDLSSVRDDPAGGVPPGRGGGEPWEPDADAVVVATFHRAKGLQWPAVFVVGLADGLVPLAAARSRAARAEERRLLYVALTRAEDELTCTWAAHPDERAALAGTSVRTPSPWLAAMETAIAELGAAARAPDGTTHAAEHLARIRQLLGAAAGGATGLSGGGEQ